MDNGIIVLVFNPFANGTREPMYISALDHNDPPTIKLDIPLRTDVNRVCDAPFVLAYGNDDFNRIGAGLRTMRDIHFDPVATPIYIYLRSRNSRSTICSASLRDGNTP